MSLIREEFQASLNTTTSRVSDPYTTEYTYPLNESVRDVVVEGLKVLTQSAAYIFAFNPMLSRLTVVTPDGSLQMSKERLDPLRANTHRMALLTDGQPAEPVGSQRRRG